MKICKLPSNSVLHLMYSNILFGHGTEKISFITFKQALFRKKHKISTYMITICRFASFAFYWIAMHIRFNLTICLRSNLARSFLLYLNLGIRLAFLQKWHQNKFPVCKYLKQ